MNLKIWIVLMVLLSGSESVMGQMGKFPNGVYLNLDQLKNQTPAYNVNLTRIVQSSGDKFMMGGNDFKFESKIDSLNSKYIRTKIYAYVKNDTMYINGLPHNKDNWFCIAIATGNFIVFSTHGSSLIGGGLGAGLAGLSDKNYVLSLRTGNVRPLSMKYVTERLKDYPELASQYEAEEYPDKPITKLKYIEELNKITSPHSVAPKKK